MAKDKLDFPNQQWLHLQFWNGWRWLSWLFFATVPAKISNKKKWYWLLLVNATNLGMVFCWRVYQLSNKNITQKDYIRTIVHILTKRSTTTFRADAKPGPSYTLPAEVRTDNSDHSPIQWDVCKCVVCKKNCKIRCQKCNRSFQINTCFQIFHEE